MEILKQGLGLSDWFEHACALLATENDTNQKQHILILLINSTYYFNLQISRETILNLLRLFQAEIFAEELVGFYFKVLANIFADSLILIDNEILEGVSWMFEFLFQNCSLIQHKEQLF